MRSCSLVLLVILLCPAISHAQKWKVYVLAGQSNMEGKAKVSLLKYQASNGATIERFKHLVGENDQWIERDDVFIKFLDRTGKLTVGYGSPKCIGPELEFGNTMGDRFEQPVLLIKTAWGGKSLYRDFRPPSSGLPDLDVLEKLLTQTKKRRPEKTLDDIKDSFGHYYRLMIADVQETLQNLETVFPEYDGNGYELSGFAWFQGWNDMVNADATAEYTQHMENFIRDVRKDLDATELPFVIGQLGVGGTREAPNAKRDAFKAAQAKAAELPEFRNNVSVVKTDQFWDETAAAVYKKGWKENLEEWNTVGSDYPFHYLGSPDNLLKNRTGFGGITSSS